MKKFSLFLLITMFLIGTSWATPSNTISISNSFSPNTTISSSQVNANYSEVQSKFNAHTHTDITELGTVTTGGWAATPIPTQYGGTGTDLSSAASGAIIYFNGTGTLTTLAKSTLGRILIFDQLTSTPQWLSQGTSGQVLQSNGSNKNPSWINAGVTVQVVNTTLKTISSEISSNIPIDNTPPLYNEGAKILTATITPKSATDKILVQVKVNLSRTVSQGNAVASLFVDGSGTDASVAAASQNQAIADSPVVVSFDYIYSCSNTSPHTFDVNAGGDAGSWYVNGAGATQIFGGVASSSITLTEYIP